MTTRKQNDELKEPKIDYKGQEKKKINPWYTRYSHKRLQKQRSLKHGKDTIIKE